MRLKIILVFFAGFFLSTSAEAQLLKKIKKRAKQAAEEAMIRKTEEKAAEKTEKAIDSLFSKGKRVTKGKIGKKKKEKKKGSENAENKENDGLESTSSNEELRVWSKYNFVPGDEIIFYDDLSNEESGEFPSRWDLLNGNAENASIGEDNVINMLHKAKITPLMDETSYLPEVFTIEFDAFFKRKHGPTYQKYYINLWPGTASYGYSEDRKSYCGSISLNMHGASLQCNKNGSNNEYSSYDESIIAEADEPVWRHIAIAFNKRSLKLFIDENRVLNIPNLAYKPEAFSLSLFAVYKESSAIKNMRIAKGGKKLYDRVIADGKFVTRGILFDVNQATLKPESMGVISKVAKMMQEHEDLNFSIEGHTDSDGKDEYNLDLSAQRADTVKQALIDLGIDESRLMTKGKGETVSVADNSTPEGKANNRRVEFVKL